MEIKIDNRMFRFKDDITVDELDKIGIPDFLLKGLPDNIGSDQLLAIIKWSKLFFGVMDLDKTDYGKLSVPIMFKLVSDPKMVEWLKGRFSFVLN